MADGLDAKAFASKIQAMPAGDRARAWSDFAGWVRAGAKVSAPWGFSGIALMGVAAFAGIYWAFEGLPARNAVLIGAPALIAGLALFIVGARKEKRWRQTHPFEF
ncbi:MAG: hypothetical protein Q7J28_00630 [Caulobacter sp.]|nr:hypothetical protein [Caulobacter sp.]